MTSEALGEALIPVINKLQDIFSQITLDFKLELPQVAVVGSQSSGKSSVLEALVGRDFLPRGPDICTRRPLVLQLVRQEPTSELPTEYGEFLHIKGKQFSNFEEIRDEIQAETDREAGDGKGISNKPIRLKICSPHVLTMTLVDLPGITRVPVGDQPSDIESLIRQMIISYIQHPTCIVLAVSAANVDLANSDAVSMAQAVDPEGIRTIGVMTKLDIMDKGTNAVALLKNQVVPLRLGYIGIINRSQMDINNKIDMKAARKNEQLFFEDHTEYYEVMNRCGTTNLALTLNRILVSHIQSMLPGLRMKILAQIDKRMQEMQLYGDEPPTDTPMEQGVLLLSVLTDYCQRFGAMLDGRSETIVHDLSGGAKIRDIFQNEFCRSLREIDRRAELSNEIIVTTIRNSTGVSGSLLIPQEPFELLVRRSIKTLLEPSIKCKDFVQEELLRIANESVPAELSRFAALQKKVTDATSEFIRSGGRPAEDMIKSLIECEYDYINYDHVDFIGGSNAVAEVMMDRRGRGPPSVRTDPPVPQNGQTPPPPPVVMRNLHNPVMESIGSTVEPGLKMLKSESRTDRGEGSVSSEGGRHQHREGNWLTNIFHRGDNKGDPRVENSAEQNILAAACASPRSPVVYSQPQTQPFDPHAGGGATGTSFHSQMDLAVAITRKLVDNYMNIVQGNVADMVPKAIMRFLVNRTKKGLHQHLIATLYKEDLFAELMSEKPEIAQKRKNCRAALRALREAMAALDSLPQELAQRGATITGFHASLRDSVAYTSRLYSSPRRDASVRNPFEF